MRKTMLIVESDEAVVQEISKTFRGEYHILTARNGKEAIFEITKNLDKLVAVLIGVQLPLYSGLQVLAVLNIKKMTGKFPILFIGEEEDDENRASLYEQGATAFFIKPLDQIHLLHRVHEFVEVYKKIDKLEEEVLEKERQIKEDNAELKNVNLKLIEGISEIIECRNADDSKHVKRVQGFVLILGRKYMEMYPDDGLDAHTLEVLARVSVLHDIGKISIDNAILQKKGRLTDDERLVMMSHTTKGCEVLKKLSGIQEQEYYRMAYEVIRSHHERADGSGYPDHLVGDDIPLPARIVSLCDVYDALVSDRVYKRAYSTLQSFDMIMNGECGKFDEKLIEAFVAAREEMEIYSEKNS